MQSLVISRLDYANSLLIGANKTCLKRLQIVQNSAARLITRISYRDHITPILFQLHWLPIEYRIRYKALLMCFNCLMGTAPEYLSALISPYQPSRTLRSTHQILLRVPRTNTKYGDHSFEVFTPREWNKLPVSIRSLTNLSTFKSHLKTFLFKECYIC